MYKGIDISSNNGNIDFAKAKSDIDFAIIRIGYGSDIAEQDDSMAIHYMTECEKLGIPYGVYIYSYALSNDEALSEAEHLKRMVKGRNVQLGYWFDMEDADGYKARNGVPLDVAHKQHYTDICKTFCNAIGKYVGIYASDSVFKNQLDLSQLPYMLWVANWGSDNGQKPNFELEGYGDKLTCWQYTSKGKVSGINCDYGLDMNLWYGELPNTKPIVPSQNEQPKVQTKKYKVGDFVEFTKIFATSQDNNALNPLYNGGTITHIVDGPNPYLIDNGMGWVNDSVIKGTNAPTDNSIAFGKAIKIKNGATDLNTGCKYADFVYQTVYSVIEVRGNRVVFGLNGVVTGATDISNCVLV